MPQLDPTWFLSQLFWLLIAFALLHFLLGRWALPGVQAVLEGRKQRLASDLDGARSMTEEAERAKQGYERALADARAAAQQFFSDAMAAQKAKSEEATKAMDAKAASILAEAHQKISAKKQDLMQALVPTSTELAGLVVEKLTKETLGRETIQSIVNDVLKARSR